MLGWYRENAHALLGPVRLLKVPGRPARRVKVVDALPELVLPVRLFSLFDLVRIVAVDGWSPAGVDARILS